MSLSSLPSLYTYSATIDRVIDGDTLDLTIDLGFSIKVRHRIRLLDVNTPEIYGVKKTSEEYAKGQKASNFVKDLVAQHGSQVTLQTVKDKQGKYGRYLGNVYFLDSVFLNEAIRKSEHNQP